MFWQIENVKTVVSLRLHTSSLSVSLLCSLDELGGLRAVSCDPVVPTRVLCI